MNPLYWSSRVVFLLGGLSCLALLGYAYYAQFVLELEPCPLCIFQRIAFMALGLVLFVAAAHGPGRVGSIIYGFLALVPAAVGAGVAGRHVWLQSLPPDQVPACGPDLSYMLDTFPLLETIRIAFRGTGQCAEIDWVFLGLSMPAWVLVAFVGLGLAMVLHPLLARRPRRL